MHTLVDAVAPQPPDAVTGIDEIEASPRCFRASAMARPTGPAPMTSKRSVLDSVRRMPLPAR